MFEPLLRTVARLLNRVRVNRIEWALRDELPVILKRRRLGGNVVIWLGNRFLSLAGSGACMFVRSRSWMTWEAHCTRLLYPDRPVVMFDSGNAVSLPVVPGVSLRQILKRSVGDQRAFAAAARELRRVHQILCSVYQAAWSHGDLHLDNVLFDSDTDRAVLIDFDTRHELNLGQTQRHADDLKVMLLELIASADDCWSQSARTLIREYDNVAVCEELNRQLVVPHGFAKILWYTRTNGCPTSLLEQRLQTLRAIIRAATVDRQNSESTSDSSDS